MLKGALCVQILRVGVKDSLDLVPYRPPKDLPPLGMVYGKIGGLLDKVRPTELQAGEIIDRLLKVFSNQVRTQLSFCAGT